LIVALGSGFQAPAGSWLCGVVAAFIPWRYVERPLIALMSFGLVLVTVRAGQWVIQCTSYGVQLRNYAVAASFAWLLVSMRSISMSWLERIAGFNKCTAEFSFSLYLIHFPLMLLLLAALFATGRFQQIATGYSPASTEGLFEYFLVAALVYEARGYSRAVRSAKHGACGGPSSPS
jgi:hypothetical protein